MVTKGWISPERQRTGVCSTSQGFLVPLDRSHNPAHLPPLGDALLPLMCCHSMEIMQSKPWRREKLCKSFSNYCYITHRCICWRKHLQCLAAKPYSCYCMLLKLITCSNNAYLQFMGDQFEDYISLNKWTNADFKKPAFPALLPRALSAWATSKAFPFLCPSPMLCF